MKKIKRRRKYEGKCETIERYTSAKPDVVESGMYSDVSEVDDLDFFDT